MMANPEVVRRMMMSNPQTREVMENNPEVAQMLNDPSFLRQVTLSILQQFMDLQLGVQFWYGFVSWNWQSDLFYSPYKT